MNEQLSITPLLGQTRWRTPYLRGSRRRQELRPVATPYRRRLRLRGLTLEPSNEFSAPNTPFQDAEQPSSRIALLRRMCWVARCTPTSMVLGNGMSMRLASSCRQGWRLQAARSRNLSNVSTRLLRAISQVKHGVFCWLVCKCAMMTRFQLWYGSRASRPAAAQYSSRCAVGVPLLQCMHHRLGQPPLNYKTVPGVH